MVRAKHVFSEDEVCLTPKTLLLLEDALTLSSTDHQVFLELRGVGAKLLEVLNIFVTNTGQVTPFLDDASMTHVPLVNSGQGVVLLVLFEAFKEVKQLIAIVDGYDARVYDKHIEGPT